MTVEAGKQRGTCVVGIDCATQDKKVGLALGWYEDGVARLEEVLTGSMVDSVVETVAGWSERQPTTLIAIDSPLGWPNSLGQTLQSHQAGVGIGPEPNLMFRRHTDRVVKELTGKQPLDVGADRIARTAHAALTFLEALRERTGQVIPLAWSPILNDGISAIEAYPGATLVAYGIKSSGYKKKGGHEAHRAVLEFLQGQVGLPADRRLLESNDDALDAVLCVLAGVDFLRGVAVGPADSELARKEGWIWVRGQAGRVLSQPLRWVG